MLQNTTHAEDRIYDSASSDCESACVGLKGIIDSLDDGLTHAKEAAESANKRIAELEAEVEAANAKIDELQKFHDEWIAERHRLADGP